LDGGERSLQGPLGTALEHHHKHRAWRHWPAGSLMIQTSCGVSFTRDSSSVSVSSGLSHATRIRYVSWKRQPNRLRFASSASWRVVQVFHHFLVFLFCFFFLFFFFSRARVCMQANSDIPASFLKTSSDLFLKRC
jgi:hypothetical protein